MNTHQSEFKPNPIIRDSRGVLFEPNMRIAYNRSGDVVIGKIKEVIRNEWVVARQGVEPKKWWSLKFEMIVEGEDGLISKIKNPSSFVII